MATGTTFLQNKTEQNRTKSIDWHNPRYKTTFSNGMKNKYHR